MAKAAHDGRECGELVTKSKQILSLCNKTHSYRYRAGCAEQVVHAQFPIVDMMRKQRRIKRVVACNYRAWINAYFGNSV
jgi:hypothetical protein